MKLANIELEDILEILDYIYLNPESDSSSEQKLIRKFGKKKFSLFSQFALGGKEPYAQSLGEGHKLTQLGVREYHKLKSELDQQIYNAALLENNRKLRITQILIIGAMLLTAIITAQSLAPRLYYGFPTNSLCEDTFNWEIESIHLINIGRPTYAEYGITGKNVIIDENVGDNFNFKKENAIDVPWARKSNILEESQDHIAISINDKNLSNAEYTVYYSYRKWLLDFIPSISLLNKNIIKTCKYQKEDEIYRLIKN